MLTIVSRSFPPQVSGSAILLANLLEDYTGNVNAISGYSKYSKNDPAFASPCPVVNLLLPRLLARVYDGLVWRYPTAMSRSIESSILHHLKLMKASVVFAAFPSDNFLVASFCAAKTLRLPFYVHMHDLWLENMPVDSPKARFAQKWEPVILKEATRVLCMTEAMQDHYREKYGITTFLMPHTISEKDIAKAPTEMFVPRSSSPTVLFVGGVSSQMNLDSLKVLASSADLLPSEYNLLYCTSMSLDEMRRVGIQSSRLQAKYVTRAEVQQLQSEAHVLIAPLSHKNGSPSEVRTVFSTKLLEYLISGRPIIVFAPEDSFHARSAKSKGWGYVVKEDSPIALADAIVKVSSDHSLAAQLVACALHEARSRNARIHAERLRDWVEADA